MGCGASKPAEDDGIYYTTTVVKTTRRSTDNDNVQEPVKTAHIYHRPVFQFTVDEATSAQDILVNLRKGEETESEKEDKAITLFIEKLGGKIWSTDFAKLMIKVALDKFGSCTIFGKAFGFELTVPEAVIVTNEVHLDIF